jgi:cytochrome c oxidase subunit 2
MNDWILWLLDLPPEASTYAAGVDCLHLVVITTTVFGAVLVFLLAVYWLVRYRQRRPLETTATSSISLRHEIALIGGLLSLFLAFWAVGATQYNHMRSPPAGAMTVYVTAKQWMWKFGYPNGRASMDILTVPVHRPVKLVMTSRDVIHSFYVPAFRMKQDVVPGRYYTAWFEATSPGQYAIECAEYCGVSHSRMGGAVQVLSDENYARWLDGKEFDAPGARFEGSVAERGDLASAGRDVAARRGCLACHTIDGQPHIGPTWVGLFGSEVTLADGTSVVADEAYLTRSMMDPQAQIVRGYKPVMPTYFGVLEATEVASLVEFMKSIADVTATPAITLPRVAPEPGTGSRGSLP